MGGWELVPIPISYDISPFNTLFPHDILMSDDILISDGWYCCEEWMVCDTLSNIFNTLITPVILMTLTPPNHRRLI